MASERRAHQRLGSAAHSSSVPPSSSTSSYLQRKIFARSRRVRTQMSACEPAPQVPSESAGGQQPPDAAAAATSAKCERARRRLRSSGKIVAFFARRLNKSSESSGAVERLARQPTAESLPSAAGYLSDGQASGSREDERPARVSPPSDRFAGRRSLASRLFTSISSGSLASAGAACPPDANGNRQQQPQPQPTLIVPKANTLKLPLVCRIRSVEGELMREVHVHRYELGQYLIESLCASVSIRDAKYFGLKLARSPDEQEDVRQPWLELAECVCKQIKSHAAAAPAPAGTCRAVDVYLRVKFYPPNLARVQDPFLRQYLWLQLRRDLRVGKLTSSAGNLSLLMACVLQHELGDFQAQEEPAAESVARLALLPNQDLIEEQALELWAGRLRGLKRHQAQMQFLRAAVILETYGFDYWPVRDHQRQRAYLLGFNYAGVKTIRNGRIAHHFRWHNISKIAHERRMIILHAYADESSKRKQILGFKCLSNDDCQNLYLRLLEQKYFFTVDLAYFDKSAVRRPSYLDGCSLDAGEELGRIVGSARAPEPDDYEPDDCEPDDDSLTPSAASGHLRESEIYEDAANSIWAPAPDCPSERSGAVGSGDCAFCVGLTGARSSAWRALGSQVVESGARLGQLAETILTEPANVQLAGQLGCGPQPISASGEGAEDKSPGESRADVAGQRLSGQSAVRILIVILLMNFLVRLTDGLSGLLIDLLSAARTDSGA